MQPPASTTGDQIDLNEVNGSLLLITCHEVIEDIATKFGPADAVRADVAILDGDQKGTVLNDVLFFPKILVRQLRGSVGSIDPQVIGRLGQGTAQRGQDPPWILDAPTQGDLTIGVKYEAYLAKQAPKPALIYGDEEPF